VAARPTADLGGDPLLTPVVRAPVHLVLAVRRRRGCDQQPVEVRCIGHGSMTQRRHHAGKLHRVAVLALQPAYPGSGSTGLAPVAASHQPLPRVRVKIMGLIIIRPD
jgi:hypothetical protein